MTISITDIRRYAIDRRTEITAIDSLSGHRCLINVRGQASIVGKDRAFSIEQVIEAADKFEVAATGKPQVLTRGQIATTIRDHFKSRGFSAVSKDED